MPYRTLANMIDGAVITFTDITVAKTLEARLRAALAKQEGVEDEKGHR
jgi:two-component system CheB/CheR fusion protein